MNRVIILCFVFMVFLSASISGQEKKIEAGIDENLGGKIPGDVVFTDENGKKVELKDLITKTTAIAFVYYKCPGICSPFMSEIADVVNETDLKPGEDYNIITISMNHNETFYDAAEKKRNYMKMMNAGFPEDSWHFLTGDSTSIKEAADSAGFYFIKKGEEFIHSGALIFVSKERTISRYLFPGYSDKRGFAILPFDFKMAVIETGKGNLSPTIARVLQFCFSYDPEGKSYVLNFTRLFGAGILILAAVFVVVLRKKPKKKIENTR